MSPVFQHGQLRLYLLSVLTEQPLTGYEIMKELETRFAGTYTPSAGTIYPRLAKLAEEGLVTRTDEGRTAVYTITDAGVAEVRDRDAEVRLIDSGVTSAAAMADVAREAVRAATADLKREIKEAAHRARAETRAAGTTTSRAPAVDRHEAERGLRSVDRALRGLDREARALERAAHQAVRRSPALSDEVATALAEAESRLAEVTLRVEGLLDR